MLLLSLASVLSISIVSSFLNVLKGFTVLGNMLEEVSFEVVNILVHFLDLLLICSVVFTDWLLQFGLSPSLF